MTGAQENPTNTSTATGSFSGTLDPETNVMTYTLSFTGLGSNSILAHIHGPAAVGVNANVLVDFSAAPRLIAFGATSGTGSGTINIAPTAVITATVTGDSLRKLFDLGLLYVNIHSANIGAGEIRGQITKQ